MNSPSFVRLAAFLFIEAVVLISHASSKSCDFPAIFNFGDSNCDTGGYAAAFGPLLYPQGENFKKPARRFSDGRLILDFMAEGLGLPYLHAYLDSVEADFSRGVNFATVGSPIIPQQTNILPLGGFSPFSLNIQYTQFARLRNNSRFSNQKGGIFKDLLPREEYYSQALYTFDIGQNDITAELLSSKSMQEIKSSAIPDMISNFSQIVKFVYNQGGKSFWIHNTGPIGCLPTALVNLQVNATQKDKAGCATQYNDLCQYFNKKLKEAVYQLRKDLPSAAITYVDIYSAKYTLIKQANKYGFELPLAACCGYGGEYNYSSGTRCGGTINVNGTQVLIGSCHNPSIRINWDGIHYTEAANKWIYNRIKNGDFCDPPIPLSMACYKQAN